MQDISLPNPIQPLPNQFPSTHSPVTPASTPSSTSSASSPISEPDSISVSDSTSDLDPISASDPDLISDSKPTHIDDYQPPVVNQSNSTPSTTDNNATNANDLVADKLDQGNSTDDVNDDIDEKTNDQADDSATDFDPQSLETQNIFELLGANDGTQAEKDDFLDELQEVIWENFIESDVDLLLAETEKKDLMMIQEKGKNPEVQEEMLVFLEKLIPNLEKIMMDKALELKGDLVQERIEGMKEFYVDNESALKQIDKAEEAMSNDKWADVAIILNEIAV